MPDKLITIATYNTVAEAGLVRSLLEAEGIPAFLADEESMGLNFIGFAIGGVKLQVLERDAERARSLLEPIDNQSGNEED